MPPHRTPRRAARAKPKYTFSDDDDDLAPTKTHTTHRAPPTPSPSLTPESASRSSHARKRTEPYIPRPRNPYIIFRSDFCERQKLKENGVERDHRHISRIASHVWNNLPADEKQDYRRRAEVEKEKHKEKNPGYVYTPQSRTKQAKRKVKRDGTDDKVRCRQLAELLISGVEGEEFNQAAKGLDEGVVEVELTQRTSKPAPKQRSRRGPRRSARQAVLKPDAPGEVGMKQEFSSPGPSRDLRLLSPLSASSDYSHSGSPDSRHNSYRSLDTPAFSPCGSKSPEDFEASPQLAPYLLPMYGFLPHPALNSHMGFEQVQNSNMRPGATSNVTLAALSPQGSAPSTPNAMKFLKPLPFYASQEDYRDPKEIAWHLPMPSFSMADLSERPALSDTPPPPMGPIRNSGATAEYPLSNFAPSDDSAWKHRALLVQATDEPCDTDDVDFGEYLNDF